MILKTILHTFNCILHAHVFLHVKMCCFLLLGDKYYQYEFKHQPSHEECVQMSRSSPSVLFSRYTDLFCDQTLEDLFIELFGSSCKENPWVSQTFKDSKALLSYAQ